MMRNSSSSDSANDDAPRESGIESRINSANARKNQPTRILKTVDEISDARFVEVEYEGCWYCCKVIRYSKKKKLFFVEDYEGTRYDRDPTVFRFRTCNHYKRTQKFSVPLQDTSLGLMGQVVDKIIYQGFSHHG